MYRTIYEDFDVLLDESGLDVTDQVSSESSLGLPTAGNHNFFNLFMSIPMNEFLKSNFQDILLFFSSCSTTLVAEEQVSSKQGE